MDSHEKCDYKCTRAGCWEGLAPCTLREPSTWHVDEQGSAEQPAVRLRGELCCHPLHSNTYLGDPPLPHIKRGQCCPARGAPGKMK